VTLEERLSLVLPIIFDFAKPTNRDLTETVIWVLPVVSYKDKDHLIVNIEKLTRLAEKRYFEIQVEKNQEKSSAINLDDLQNEKFDSVPVPVTSQVLVCRRFRNYSGHCREARAVRSLVSLTGSFMTIYRFWTISDYAYRVDKLLKYDIFIVLESARF